MALRVAQPVVSQGSQKGKGSVQFVASTRASSIGILLFSSRKTQLGFKLMNRRRRNIKFLCDVLGTECSLSNLNRYFVPLIIIN